MQSSENTHPSEPELEKSLESTTKLKLRVEDWKGYNVMLLGDLLLQDIMPIETPKSTRIYEVFLFEKIFLACKILSSGFNTFYMKPRDGSSGKIKDRTTGLLQLKGRIFMRDIKQVQSAVDADNKCTLQIFWKDYDEKAVQIFTLHLQDRAKLRIWESHIKRFRHRECERIAFERAKLPITPTESDETGGTPEDEEYGSVPTTADEKNASIEDGPILELGKPKARSVDSLEHSCSPFCIPPANLFTLGGRPSTRPATHRIVQVIKKFGRRI